jgi:hypothetical protein
MSDTFEAATESTPNAVPSAVLPPRRRWARWIVFVLAALFGVSRMSR